MSRELTLSLNEFRALLRKAFEGIYGHGRDWNALADLVLWLEYRGLDGLDILFEAEAVLTLPHSQKIKRNDDGQIILDGEGGSLMSFCLELGDLFIASAKSSGEAVLHIQNISHPEIIAATVDRCAKCGLASAAWWPGQGNWGSIAFQDAGEEQPNIYRIELPTGFENHEDITVIANKSLSDITNNHPDWFSFLKSDQRPSNEINDLYLEHLDNGYRISLEQYKRLCEMSDRVLVEATEQSRQGAGE